MAKSVGGRIFESDVSVLSKAQQTPFLTLVFLLANRSPSKLNNLRFSGFSLHIVWRPMGH